MTINHNENVKKQKIEKMKKVAKEIVDSKNKDLGWFDLGNHIITVSYTHLTLPTSDLV